MKLPEHLKRGAQIVAPAVTPHVSACVPGMNPSAFMLRARRDALERDEKRMKLIENKFKMYLWKCIALIACTEYALYRSSDMLIEHETPEYMDKRLKAMEQFDKCKTVLNKIIDTQEDIMLDFQRFIIKKMSRRINTMTNAVTRKVKGSTTGCDAECVARTAVCIKLIQTFKTLKRLTEDMGAVKLYPKNDVVDLAECYIDDTHELLCDIYTYILGDNNEDESESPKVNEQFHKFFSELSDNKLYNYCIEKAEKENTK